jgi:hypothetical protein
MESMGPGFDAEYQPNPGKVEIYQKRYIRYLQLGDLMEANADPDFKFDDDQFGNFKLEMEETL